MGRGNAQIEKINEVGDRERHWASLQAAFSHIEGHILDMRKQQGEIIGSLVIQEIRIQREIDVLRKSDHLLTDTIIKTKIGSRWVVTTNVRNTMNQIIKRYNVLTRLTGQRLRAVEHLHSIDMASARLQLLWDRLNMTVDMPAADTLGELTLLWHEAGIEPEECLAA